MEDYGRRIALTDNFRLLAKALATLLSWNKRQ